MAKRVLEGNSDRHPLRAALKGMKQRCYNPRNKSYKNYGGRGIFICEKWLSDKWEFIAWAYEAGWKPGLTIERIDVNGPYSPNNCTWIPKNQQPLNNRRRIVTVTSLIGKRDREAFGDFKNLAKWSRDDRCLVSYRCLKDRLSKGWDLESAISTPPMDNKTKGKLAMEKRWNG